MSALGMLSAEAVAELVALVADEVERRGTASHPRDAVSRWMSIEEAAEYLRCKPQRVRNLRSSRRLTPYVEGGRALCDRREVGSLVEGV